MAIIRVYNVYYDKCMRINMHYVTFGKHNRDILVRAYTTDCLSLQRDKSNSCSYGII